MVKPFNYIAENNNLVHYHTLIKFCGLIFHVFDWQENLWGIIFRGYCGEVDTIVVRFTKYASYCGLIFLVKGIP